MKKWCRVQAWRIERLHLVFSEGLHTTGGPVQEYRITAKYKAFQNNEGYYKNIKWHWNTLLKEKCAWVVEGKMQLVIMVEGMLTKYRHLKWENSIWENNPFNALLSCGSIPLFITFISQPASSFVTSQNQHNSIEITGITPTDFKKDMI